MKPFWLIVIISALTPNVIQTAEKVTHYVDFEAIKQIHRKSSNKVQQKPCSDVMD